MNTNKTSKLSKAQLSSQNPGSSLFMSERRGVDFLQINSRASVSSVAGMVIRLASENPASEREFFLV